MNGSGSGNCEEKQGECKDKYFAKQKGKFPTAARDDVKWRNARVGLTSEGYKW